MAKYKDQISEIDIEIIKKMATNNMNVSKTEIGRAHV